MSPAPLLAARDLAIGYERPRHRGSLSRSGAPLARGINLELRPGSLVALVGPNGAGKSTLLRSLLGMQPILGGSVELCGLALSRLSVEERATRAAAVFTDRFDSGWFTVGEIVAFGRFPYTDLRNRLSDHDRDSIEKALDSVGLREFAGRRLVELSDGERQKALIARGLAQDTPLLVLDEPTAFLDAPARIEIFHLASSIARRGDRAVILSTHDVELALRHADQVWLFDREHRFAAGAPETLALEGALGRAFDGRGVVFDPLRGAFRSAEPHARLSLAVRAKDPFVLAWTRRLADRLGFILKPEEEAPDLLVVASTEGGAREWILRRRGSEGELRVPDLDSLAECLLDFLVESTGGR
jgi:iron complex transport system ATP-binding protein